MLAKKQWDLLLGENRLPCLLAQLKTGEILYINQEMDAYSGNLLGKNLRELLEENTKSASMDFMEVWKTNDIFEQKLYASEQNRSYVVKHMKFEFDGEEYHFCQFKPDSNIDFNFEESMSKCIVAARGDEEEKIPSLLRILGEYYQADKAYLYHIKRKFGKIPCVSAWVRDASMSIIPDLGEKMDSDRLLEWFDTRNEIGMIDAALDQGTCVEGSMEYQVLRGFSLENVVMSVVENKQKEAVGMVLICNRQSLELDFRLLQAVTHFMERDVTQSDLNTAVQQLSDQDMLTGFYNRISYSQTVDYLEARPPKKLGVVLANVNGLKQINSEFGLSRGDTYIKKAADLLKNHFEIDFFRTAGDEFVGFFPEIEKEIFQQKVSDLLEKMKTEGNHVFALGHAWGKGRFNPVNLVKEADTMMYINKQEFYHSSVHYFEEIVDNTLHDLLRAVEEKEFVVYLQPQVLLEDASLYGAEALVRRFERKNGKMSYPDQFIALYEQKSVIRHIDIFVIEEVCGMLAQWKERGIEIPISVNLSRVTLLEFGIVDTIAEICDRFQVNRSLLVIEVTERVGLIESNVPSTLVNEFKEKGFKISLDDFGCAYSNIVTLAQIEVDEVKIDKSLVDYLESNSKNRVLVKNVLSMCQELDRTSTLAEGIENQEQADLLHSLGCHLGQGYLYSEPISMEEFAEKYFSF